MFHPSSFNFQPSLRIFATISLALRALRRNKMRSVLTMLGIIIGVGSVIAAVSITTGATKQVEDRVAALGQNVITVFSGNFTSGGMRGGWGSAPTLTIEDANAIKNDVADVVGISPEVRDRNQILTNGLNWNTQILGESPDYPQIRSWGLASGSMFTDGDVRSLGKVAVIGKTVADQLFTNQDPLGQTLRIRNIPFKIVGLLEPKGFNLFGQDQDDVVIIPYTSHMRRITPRTFVNSIQVQAATTKAITKVSADITELLKARHRGSDQDFTVRTQLEVAQMATATSKIMSVLLAAIASVSLIVGGIGIMNIMLASILERIKEIGVRRAMGATQRDILAQFLSEAVMISLAGGITGIVIGVAVSSGIQRFAGIETIVSFLSVAVAFGVSIAVGLVFGIVPARNAARQDVIVCLRYE